MSFVLPSRKSCAWPGFSAMMCLPSPAARIHRIPAGDSFPKRRLWSLALISISAKTVLAILPLIVPVSTISIRFPSCRGDTRQWTDLRSLELTQQLGHHPVCDLLRRSARGQGSLEVVGQFVGLRQYDRIVFGKIIVSLKALLSLVGKFGERTCGSARSRHR